MATGGETRISLSQRGGALSVYVSGSQETARLCGDEGAESLPRADRNRAGEMMR